METNRTGFSPGPLIMHKTALPTVATSLKRLAPSSSKSGWMSRCLFLLAIFVFLEACTLDPEPLKRVSRETLKETLTSQPRDAAAANQKKGSDRSGPNMSGQGVAADANAKQVVEESDDQELTVRGINLTNFKDRLATLSRVEVIELMGLPEFKRSEPPARIWQYRAPDCVVDLFFYDDGGSLAVEHVDLRTREAGSVDVTDRVCFASIIQKPTQNTSEADPSIGRSKRGAREPYTGNL